MSHHTNFTAFFSYAHHDAETDPVLIEAFTSNLEKRINSKIINAQFSIWRDRTGLRTGDRWVQRLQEEIESVHIFIVLLTPRWLHSDYCRREFDVFEQASQKKSAGDYVVPILARSLETQRQFFNVHQEITYAKLNDRQYAQAIAADFLALTNDERTLLIDRLADDVVGMIARLRSALGRSTGRGVGKRTTKEFDYSAQNFDAVSFIKFAEVVLETKTIARGRRRLRAQVGFFHCLFVEGATGRIQFGVRRAYLTVGSAKKGTLEKIDAFKIGRENAYYATLHDAENNITIVLDAAPDSPTLADLAFPPDEDENFLATIGTVSSIATSSDLTAYLAVSLSAEGLFVFESAGQPLSSRSRQYVESIMEVAIKKAAGRAAMQIDKNGTLRQLVIVEDKE